MPLPFVILILVLMLVLVLVAPSRRHCETGETAINGGEIRVRRGL